MLRTFAESTVFLCPLLILFIVYRYWRIPFRQWTHIIGLSTGLLACVIVMASGVFLGDIVLLITYWLLWLLHLNGISYSYAAVGLRQTVLRTALILLVLVSATYLRYIPKADAFARCSLHAYAIAVTDYHTAHRRYPLDIYARGESNPLTLVNGIKNDIAVTCRTESDELWTLYWPQYSVIRYDLHSDSYLLRGYYTYDPLFTGLKLYRTCVYNPASQQVQCHLQLTQPFEPPLNNY